MESQQNFGRILQLSKCDGRGAVHGGRRVDEDAGVGIDLTVVLSLLWRQTQRLVLASWGSLQFCAKQSLPQPLPRSGSHVVDQLVLNVHVLHAVHDEFARAGDPMHQFAIVLVLCGFCQVGLTDVQVTIPILFAGPQESKPLPIAFQDAKAVVQVDPRFIVHGFFQMQVRPGPRRRVEQDQGEILLTPVQELDCYGGIVLEPFHLGQVEVRSEHALQIQPRDLTVTITGGERLLYSQLDFGINCARKTESMLFMADLGRPHHVFRRRSRHQAGSQPARRRLVDDTIRRDVRLVDLLEGQPLPVGGQPESLGSTQLLHRQVVRRSVGPSLDVPGARGDLGRTLSSLVDGHDVDLLVGHESDGAPVGRNFRIQNSGAFGYTSVGRVDQQSWLNISRVPDPEPSPVGNETHDAFAANPPRFR
mmetsp:Transcript_43734/g.92969  ORF Transcript_43734/g.92969 Transcript_43734/m.92969 type:complete len:419 (+) Transcript_43734:995-2251(+)